MEIRILHCLRWKRLIFVFEITLPCSGEFIPVSHIQDLHFHESLQHEFGLIFINCFVFFCEFQYAIKLATKLNEKRLSSITELTAFEDKPIKLLDTGQRDKDRDKDNRDREREWNYKNISQNHITNNHEQSVVNHTSHVSYSLFSVQSTLRFNKIATISTTYWQRINETRKRHWKVEWQPKVSSSRR